jgi:hypothetical protein
LTLRWKSHTRHILGFTDLIEDRDGARRIVAEGDWLAVVYPRDLNVVYIESIERSEARRRFSVVKLHGTTALHVAKLEISSTVGSLGWVADSPAEDPQPLPKIATGLLRSIIPTTAPSIGILTGQLTLPDGTSHPTGTGSGFFEAPGLVRGYATWQDRDVAEGWSVVTEVEPNVPEELRPLLAAFPLLFFTSPPVT